LESALLLFEVAYAFAGLCEVGNYSANSSNDSNDQQICSGWNKPSPMTSSIARPRNLRFAETAETSIGLTKRIIVSANQAQILSQF